MKQSALIWLPVLLLPAVNLLSVSSDRYIAFEMAPIFGAVLEELIYRWFLLKKVLLGKECMEPYAASIVAAVLFSMMHLWNFRSGMPYRDVCTQLFLAFGFSMWAGACVWRTGGIVPPLLAHILFNFTASIGPLMMYVVLAFILLLDGLLLFFCGRDHVLDSR